jgi:lactoylglutathione lyase
MGIGSRAVVAAGFVLCDRSHRIVPSTGYLAEGCVRSGTVVEQSEGDEMSQAQRNGSRIMHTMIRVGDLDRSINFYAKHFGMSVVKKVDVPEALYTNVFIGYGSEDSDPMIELTYNYGTTSYDHGKGFGHIAVGVRDIYAVCDALRAEGVKIVREPGPVKFGTVHIAFVDDPDGYRIELIDIGTGDYAEAGQQ